MVAVDPASPDRQRGPRFVQAVKLLHHFVLYGAERCVDHAWDYHKKARTGLADEVRVDAAIPTALGSDRRVVTSLTSSKEVAQAICFAVSSRGGKDWGDSKLFRTGTGGYFACFER